MAVTPTDSRRLWATAGERCSICSADLVSAGPGLLGEMAHIVARKPTGPRGDDPLPVAARDSYDNLILLCPNDHKLIDQVEPDKWPKERLRQEKASHESRIRNLLDNGVLQPFDDGGLEEVLDGRIQYWEERGLSVSYLALSPLLHRKDLLDPLLDAREKLEALPSLENTGAHLNRYQTSSDALGLVSEDLWKCKDGEGFRFLMGRAGIVEIVACLDTTPYPGQGPLVEETGVGEAQKPQFLPYSWLERRVRAQIAFAFAAWDLWGVSARDRWLRARLVGMPDWSMVVKAAYESMAGRRVRSEEEVAADLVIGEDVDLTEALFLVLRRLVNCAGLELDPPGEDGQLGQPRKIIL